VNTEWNITFVTVHRTSSPSSGSPVFLNSIFFILVLLVFLL